MHLNVPASLIHFTPASNTITLDPPFNQITDKDVFRIRDDTTKELIYDRQNLNRDSAISVANGVITYTYDNDHQASNDAVQIELEFGYYAPIISVWAGQSVSASATVNQSSKIYVEGAATIWLKAAETGASSVTINVLSYNTSDGPASSAISVATISSSTPAPIIVEVGLPYISLQVINGDAVNAASVTADLVITWR